LAIIVGVIFFLSCVSIFSSVYIISNAYAQEKTKSRPCCLDPADG
jgi:hypothetical protein